MSQIINSIQSPLSDLRYMKKAIALGEKGRLTAPPNPWVGCLVVKDKEVIGEGYHHFAGGPHAEIVALEEAGNKAEGATVYTTLEPCCHEGRTSPCVKALIKAKVGRVVSALEDPDPKVAGKGFTQLKEAAIDVTVGIGNKAAEESLFPYLHQRKTQRPYTILKSAITIDGKVAAADGTSQWITTEEAREDVHWLRAHSQAILIGSGTAAKDLPKLTVRHPQLPEAIQPLRVLLDSSGKLSATGPLSDKSLAPTLIMTTEKASKSYLNNWKAIGAEVEILPTTSKGKVELKAALSNLGKRGILQLLVEGGSEIYSALWKEELIDKYILYIGACAMGGKGIPLFSGEGGKNIADLKRWKLENMERFGDNVRLDYTVIPETP